MTPEPGIVVKQSEKLVSDTEKIAQVLNSKTVFLLAYIIFPKS
jgi:hypothetical protein